MTFLAPTIKPPSTNEWMKWISSTHDTNSDDDDMWEASPPTKRSLAGKCTNISYPIRKRCMFLVCVASLRHNLMWRKMPTKNRALRVVTDARSTSSSVTNGRTIKQSYHKLQRRLTCLRNHSPRYYRQNTYYAYVLMFLLELEMKLQCLRLKAWKLKKLFALN